ncbi:hypothetical protein [Akkermansia sp.]|uniref:hypothetical protein n=1 Tax=Akkermansia sp. TaxID=1872421 RepID=UPI00399483AD
MFVERLLDGYTVAEASWMSMSVVSWQGVVFGDPLYRPYARMKSMDVQPSEEDRYFQGWWASRLQFGDRWRERAERLLESARKAPSSFLYEALALEYLYRKEYVQAGNMVSTAPVPHPMPGTIPAFCWSPCWWTVPGEGTRRACSRWTASRPGCPPRTFCLRLRNGAGG